MKPWHLILLVPLFTGCDLLRLHNNSEIPRQVVNGTAVGKKIIYVMGQSNGLGAGQTVDYPNVRGVTLVNVSHDPYVAYRGPAISFAAALVRRNPNLQIEIRQCSVGSSPMEYWTRPLGTWASEPDKEDVLAVLFWQGETDTLYPFDSFWAQRFNQMVLFLRTDFGNLKLPIIFVKIAPMPLPLAQTPGYERVREDQESIHTPGVELVRIDDLRRNSPMHYGADEYWETGRRMAQAYFGIE